MTGKHDCTSTISASDTIRINLLLVSPRRPRKSINISAQHLEEAKLTKLPVAVDDLQTITLYSVPAGGRSPSVKPQH